MDFNTSSDIIDLTYVTEIISFDDLQANHITASANPAGSYIADGLGNEIYLYHVHATDHLTA